MMMMMTILFFLLALTAPLVHAQQTNETACNLTEDCESMDSFCGVNGICLPLTCENVYQFGNRTFTGYDETNPAPLECTSIPETGDEEFSTTPSLTYRCTNISSDQTWYVAQGYTRKCTANSFECYSIDPSTDFTNFLQRTSQVDCSPSNELPFFNYVGILEWNRGIQSYVGVQQVHNITYEFDPQAALQGTIYTKMNLDPPTESPTVSPTTVSPSTSAPTVSGSIGKRGVVSSTVMAFATGLALVVWTL